MKRRKTSRLLAGLLALVIALSLCEVTMGQSTPAKAAVSLQNPTIDGNGVTTWDCIYFGNYWQEDTNGDGKADQNDKKEPIKWRVLSVNENDAFLLSDKNLDFKPYNEEDTNVTWATCTLRTWLNDTFLNTAFTSAEQAVIKDTTVVNEDSPYWNTEGGENTTDKVYLLSIAEASNTSYGFNGKFKTDSETRVATNTAYVAGKDGTNAVGEADWWWLRSRGLISYFASLVNYNGYGDYDGDYVYYDYDAVRPALHLNLSSSTLWSYAGKVTASGGDSSQATPTPKPVATEPPTVISSIVTNKSGNTGKTSSKKTLPKVKLRVSNNKKGKKLVVKWDVVKGAKGYQLQYALNKKFKKKKSIQTKKNKYTIKKLKKKTYYIRVRAYKMNGRKKVYGKWSKVKVVKRK